MDSSGANLKRWKMANEQMCRAIEELCKELQNESYKQLYRRLLRSFIRSLVQ